MGQQSKYHVTDEGKVYRIEDNGEVTEMGDVSDLGKSPKTPQRKPKTKPSPKRRQQPKEDDDDSGGFSWGCLMVIVAIVLAIMHLLHYII